MPEKNIILNSLRESFFLIWKNKPLFVLLFILQILFFGLLFFVSQNYIPKIIENAKSISDYLSQQKLDEISMTQNILQQKSILGDDPLSISRNFSEMVRNFRMYLIYIFISLIIFLCLFWALTYKIIHKTKLNQIVKISFRIFIVLLAYLGLIFSFFYSVFNISFTEAAYDTSKLLGKYTLLLFASLVLSYFMFISISLAGQIQLRHIIQKTLTIGIKKIHYISAAYIINIFLIITPLILLSYFIEIQFFIGFFSLLLVLFSFTLSRILVISVVEKLSKD